MVAQFRRRRDLIVEGLHALPGITCLRPKGAFYVFPNVSALGRPEKEIAQALLEEAGIATLAGTAFGEYGKGYLRLSYANSLVNIQKALERMDEWLA
jgi:aspartate/methionine/tyrosine aminotransferase